MSGLALTETLTGTLRLAADPGRERPIALTYRATTGPLPGVLRGRALAVEGAIEAEGFAEHRLLRGSVALVLRPARALDYALSFAADDGATYRFTGARSALTLLPGLITREDGALAGRALLRFDLRSDLGRLLASIRRLRS